VATAERASDRTALREEDDDDTLNAARTRRWRPSLDERFFGQRTDPASVADQVAFDRLGRDGPAAGSLADRPQGLLYRAICSGSRRLLRGTFSGFSGLMFVAYLITMGNFAGWGVRRTSE